MGFDKNEEQNDGPLKVAEDAPELPRKHPRVQECEVGGRLFSGQGVVYVPHRVESDGRHELGSSVHHFVQGRERG